MEISCLEREHNGLTGTGQATNALHAVDGFDNSLVLLGVKGGDRIFKPFQLRTARVWAFYGAL